MKIKFLSETTINRIAAGEVIERPASVVKELVENAIDAGADNIEIILERAGKNLIIIADNGWGMSEEDLKVAVQRHTTSKLDEDNLLNINSFGFRGEALPSIGAISKMTITSKQKGSDHAYRIELVGGIDKGVTLASYNIGTRIEIRDLFFATPARLKFLRTDKTELFACVDIVKKIALAHPNISFSLISDDKAIFKIRKIDSPTQENILHRIGEIVGEEFIKNSSEVNFVIEDINISGYVAIPTYNRASGDEQFLFINNRPVKDKLLNVALRVAYQDYLSRDRFPVAILFLKINPVQVDVNVHPAKTEVRFHDPNLIRSSMISAIRDALASISHNVSTTVGNQALERFNTSRVTHGMHYAKSGLNIAFNNHVAENSKNYLLPGQQYKVMQEPLIITQPYSKSIEQEAVSTMDETSLPEINIPAPTGQDFPLGAARVQFNNTYIIAQTKDSIILIDQHAAHERLGYEKIKRMIAARGLIKQRLLMPEIVELLDNNRAELIYSNKNQLSDLGLSLDKFGENTIIVSEIPSLLGNINVSKLINDLSDHLLAFGENIALTELIEHVTETYACHYAIRAGRSLNINEMNELLRQMESTPFSGQCNHGRPTYIELKIKDIEKLFGRK